MRPEVAEEVFDLLDRRWHSSAPLLTSNRDVTEWETVFPDPVLASAVIDRLFDSPHVVIFTGDSCRRKGKIALKESLSRKISQEVTSLTYNAIINRFPVRGIVPVPDSWDVTYRSKGKLDFGLSHTLICILS